MIKKLIISGLAIAGILGIYIYVKNKKAKAIADTELSNIKEEIQPAVKTLADISNKLPIINKIEELKANIIATTSGTAYPYVEDSSGYRTFKFNDINKFSFKAGDSLGVYVKDTDYMGSPFIAFIKNNNQFAALKTQVKKL